MPAGAEVFFVTLNNGTSIETAYQPQEASWDTGMVLLLTETGDLEGAKSQYQEALAQLRHSPTAHAMIGYVELRLQRPRAAEAHFREALKLDPNGVEVQLGLAEALEGQNKTAEAQAMFEEQVRRTPEADG